MKITPLSSPKPNDWGYKGPAAYNPYFFPKGTEPDLSVVLDFYTFFDAVAVYDITTGNVNHYVNPKHTASPDGAEEALRLVSMFVPGATLESVRGIEGGIYYADKLTYSVVLPDGKRLNAAKIVDRYYHAGAGVSAESDLELMDELGVEKPKPTVPDEPKPAESPKPVPPPANASPVGEPDMEGDYATLPGSEKYTVGQTVTESRGTFIKVEKPSPFGQPWTFWKKVW